MRASSRLPSSTASCPGSSAPPSACRSSPRPASNRSSRAPSPIRRTAPISRARRPGRRTTGCIAAPRSVSARAAAPANTWRNGWCMARRRLTCWPSTHVALAPMPTVPTPRPKPIRNIGTCTTCNCPARSGWQAVPSASRRSTKRSRPKAAYMARRSAVLTRCACTGAASRQANTKAARNEAIIGGRRGKFRRPAVCVELHSRPGARRRSRIDGRPPA